MGRAHPIPVVYMLTNNVNNKIYIGETYNFAGRMSAYRSVAKRNSKWNIRPIDKAIMKYGIESFTVTILVDSSSEPNLMDDIVRCNIESNLIKRYNATDPRIGYNTVCDDIHMHGIPKVGKSHSTQTKLKKSEPIITYDTEDETCLMYLGKRSFSEILGIDRSIVARASKNGLMVHGYHVYVVDGDKRRKYAERVIYQKTRASKTNGKVNVALPRYLNGLAAVNKFCAGLGLPVIPIDDLIRS